MSQLSNRKITNKMLLAREAMKWIENQNIVTLQYWDNQAKAVDLFHLFLLWFLCKREDRDFSAEYNCDFEVVTSKLPDSSAPFEMFFIGGFRLNNSLEELKAIAASKTDPKLHINKGEANAAA